MAECDYRELAEDPATPLVALPQAVPPLRTFYLYMSNSCNLACRHCWITPRFVNGKPDPGDVIDVEALRAAVIEAKPMGLSSAKLTGGEPMLHPQFLEIVDMLTAEGLEVNMETNGTLLTPEIARYLKDQTNLGFTSVSLDGADAATHDAFRGVEGAFDATLRGLDALVAAGYTNSQVIMSVHHANRSQIDDLIRLAADHGAGSVKLNPITNNGRGAAMHDRGESLNFDEHLELSRDVYDGIRARAPIGVVLWLPLALQPLAELQRTAGQTGDCGVRHILGMLGTGEIVLCGIGRTVPELVYGRLGVDSIREIWLGHPTILELRRVLEEHRKFPGICGECVFAAKCRTNCVAQNYVDGRQLVWPNVLCAEAAERGLFPASRRKPGK